MVHWATKHSLKGAKAGEAVGYAGENRGLMEVRPSSPCPTASGNLKSERQNETLKIQNKWENCFPRDSFLFV